MGIDFLIPHGVYCFVSGVRIPICLSIV
jgi:hypothetical protein